MEKVNELARDFFGKFSYRGVLAIIIVSGCFAFLFSLLFKKIPEGNESALNMAMGFILGVLATVAGYYFGASKDKSDQEKADNVSSIIEAGKPDVATLVSSQNSGA